MNGFTAFMTHGGWAVFTVIGAVFSAGFYLVNQYLKQPGHHLVFWMRVLIVLFMSPFIKHVTLPDNWAFYAAVALTVLAGTFADIRTFNVCAQYGGGVVSRVQPMTVVGTFLVWFLFKPHLLAAYAQAPLNTACIVLALGGCVYFAMRLNRCPVTRAVLIAMAPAIAGYTLSTVLNKFAMEHGQLEGAVFGYMYVQSFLAVFFIGGYCLWHERREKRARASVQPPSSWASKQLAVAALLAALVWICLMIYRNYAMAFTPNPSYVAALNLITPVYIALFYRLAKVKEEADVVSGMGVVACAVLLALFAIK